MVRVVFAAAFVLGASAVVLAQMSLSGDWDFTLQLLPTVEVYDSDLTLKFTLAGWSVESESSFDALGFEYQSFYWNGDLGPFDLWGKIYFQARDVLYRRAWANVELEEPWGTFRLSFNHWRAASEYTDSDKDKFGPWPCLETISWEDAWKHMGRSVYVSGPVRGYYYAGGALTLNIGADFPSPERFQIYIPAANVPRFEAAFGPAFWTGWVGQEICVSGTVKGYRYTSGGPGGGGYSVAEMSITSPASLSLGPCGGYRIPLTCPEPVVKWFLARHSYVGQTVCVQGPVVSISGPGTYHGYAGHYRIRLGGGETVPNRVEVILRYRPAWTVYSGTSYSTAVCVCGTVTLSGGVAVILPPNVVSASGSPCCTSAGLPGTLVNWRFSYTVVPFTLTVDFSDCGLGTSLRGLELAVADLALCCGLDLDASVRFTKTQGWTGATFSVDGLAWGCCGLISRLTVEFTPTRKIVQWEPRWSGVKGCLIVYGDARWTGTTWEGLAVYGFDLRCTFGPWYVRSVTALDPDAVEDATDVTFYADEFEYLGLDYGAGGCCGGALDFLARLWFGTRGKVLGLQRFRFDLEVPVGPKVELVFKGQWNLAKVVPLEWFDLGFKVSL